MTYVSLEFKLSIEKKDDLNKLQSLHSKPSGEKGGPIEGIAALTKTLGKF